MNPLLENAVVSIQLGLEDFASEDQRRMVAAARNLYAGVLLLCKEVLRQLSPPNSNDLLIRTKRKAVKDADGTVRLIGHGKKTIDRAEIEDLMWRYTRALDTNDAAAYAATYTADGQFSAPDGCIQRAGEIHPGQRLAPGKVGRAARSNHIAGFQIGPRPVKERS